MERNRLPRRRMPPLSLAQKRRVLLGLNDEQIRELLARGTEDDFEEIGDQTGLGAEQVQHVASEPEMLSELRLDPNRLRREQLEQIPDLDATDIDAIMLGKPYYSLAELGSVTGFSLSALQQLFQIDPYRFSDPIMGREVMLEPVAGRYILPPSELEADPALSAGYAEVYAPTERIGLRVVEAVDFEAEQRPHLLKREFGGQVYPVMRDSQGFERYLAPGTVDVWFKREVPERTRQEILNELHLQAIQSVPEVGYYRTRLVAIPESQDMIHATLKAIAAADQRTEEVIFAEPDQLGFEDFPVDSGDADLEDDFESLERDWNELAIELDAAHAITRGSSDVTIFVIDSGCRMDHEELEPAFRDDWDSLDLSFDLGEAPAVSSPDERGVSHGTKVAGVVRQVAPDCRILPIKIPSNAGGSAAPGYGLRAAAILKALDYVPSGKRAVMNLSWKTNGEHIGIREALRSAEARGLVLVASAGNYAPGVSQRPNDLHYPSAHAYLPPVNRALVSAAAVGPGDVRAGYSYYGSESVTVSAPGGEPGGVGSGIYTATTSTSSSHTYVAGTSFAAPHVAGLAALLLSANPALTAEQIIVRIKDTSDDLDAVNPGFRGQLGGGRINTRAALEQGTGPAPTHTVTATASSHGAIVPAGDVTILEGGSRRFEFVPDPGYHVANVLLDGVSIGAPDSHSLSSVSADHTLAVTFAKPPPSEVPQGLVNINTASAAELDLLPHIGSWLADQIVAYREAHGPYASIWDLSAVGMTDWAVGQIESLITV